MADETGIQFIERIKEKFQDLLFVVLTAYADLDTVLDAINTGVFHFIQKPWEQKEMLQVITNAIDKYDLQKRNKELLNELKNKNEELKDSNDELLSLARHYRERKRKSVDHESLLNAVFRNLPLIILLVDAERKIIKINKEGLEISKKNLDRVLGTRGGDALNCVYALENPNGCGASEACKHCIVQNTIINSLQYKTDYYKVEAKFTMKKDGLDDERKVFVCTAGIAVQGPRVLVSVDDVTSHKEIDSLK